MASAQWLVVGEHLHVQRCNMYVSLAELNVLTSPHSFQCWENQCVILTLPDIWANAQTGRVLVLNHPLHIITPVLIQGCTIFQAIYCTQQRPCAPHTLQWGREHQMTGAGVGLGGALLSP